MKEHLSIYKNNLTKTEYYERLDHISQYAEIYFQQENKITYEITNVLKETYDNISTGLSSSIDIVNLCLVRSKWLQLNWEVFELYYNTIDS